MLSLIFLTSADAANPDNAWALFPTFQMSPAIGTNFTTPMTEVFNDFWWIPVNFETFLVTDNDFSTSLNNGESEIAFTSSLSLLCGNGADGCCWSVNDSNGHRIESDIYMDSTVSWTTGKSKTNTFGYGGGSRPFRTTFLHEYGHAVGLGHENGVMNIMGQDWTYASTNGSTMDIRIGEDALTGLRSLYGDWPEMRDVRVMHWKYDFANGAYSWHARNRLLNSATGNELPHTIPTTTVGNGDPGEKLYQVNQGQALVLEYTFENLGTDTLPTVPFRILLSTNNLISTGDTPIGSGTFFNLIPNTPYTGTFGVTLPTNLVRGADYWIGIQLDSTGMLAEHDEKNNFAYIASIVVP